VFSIGALLVILIGIPLAIFSYEAKRSGQTLGQYLERTLSKLKHDTETEVAFSEKAKGQTLHFLEEKSIGDPVGDTKPWITNLEIVDLDGDGLNDVVLCDAKLNEVRWIRQFPADTYTETKVGDTIRGPAHVTASDIDKDGDLDLLVG
ncbi:MAG: FG-GAP repeat domain-containing protein, partial [Planctomycetota bacterium]